MDMDTDTNGQDTDAPKPSPWGFWATIGFSLLILIGTLVATTIVMIGLMVAAAACGHAVNGEAMESAGFLVAVATCVSTPVAIVLAMLFARLRKSITISQYFGFRRPGARQYVKWTLVCLLMLAITEALNAGLDRPIPEVLVTIYRTTRFFPLLWLAVVVGAPLSEEIVCRGFLLKGLQNSWCGTVGAVMLSSLAWSVLHIAYGPYETSTIFVLGLVLGAARVNSKSIYVPIMMHAIWNLAATIQLANYVRSLPS